MESIRHKTTYQMAHLIDFPTGMTFTSPDRNSYLVRVLRTVSKHTGWDENTWDLGKLENYDWCHLIRIASWLGTPCIRCNV